METKFSLLEKILPHIDTYVERGGIDDPMRFARWLSSSVEEWDSSQVKIVDTPDFDPVRLMSKSDPNAALSFYLVRLNKYAKYYIKDAFSSSPLKSADDFAYVAALANVASLTKSELIAMNVGETSGGMDIIRRLEREGVLESFTDDKDKRAKRVRLTEYGKGVFFSVLPPLQRVGKIVKAHMKKEEVARLVEILGTLDQFHKKIYDEQKEYDLDTIEECYME
ncbi:MarR family winged helix-turn-helix transcriptional regulator [Phaeocystidibacter luteus]|uniref:MarR family transcriptional regulator n=1 Tax=Phaeocystidibacter luteus TaxID=911197 RepID=A0A6N6RHH3_9FLAO|nr:MarR family winged helix-turn-helix transcriptional regulator [Phaeocystidibacter luteus]KAB2809920.1 MarR family transcriptional regulator [Phaeocystidibacter luteus]